ncbi:MAG TPA: protein phosphatase 2C domain-containing protein [Dermatophilaceae bacterium]|nr:protein phosphatase 2C domain-containing protein [Dermatophilaceae bacterium]
MSDHVSDHLSTDGTHLRLRAGAATDVGRVRAHNEDAALAEGMVFAVADGMGGHAAGEVASGITVEALRELAGRRGLRPDDVIGALATANQRILERAARQPDQRGMGTTAAGIAVVSAGGSDHWAVFNIGDSRVYRIVDDQIQLVTVDHSEVRELIDAGVITEAEAAVHPLRNVVTRSLGSRPMPTPDVWVFPPHPGERFVICSDGLSNELSAAAILDLASSADDPQQAAEALVHGAVQAGGRDNVTAIVVALDPGDGDDGDVDTAPRGANGTVA